MIFKDCENPNTIELIKFVNDHPSFHLKERRTFAWNLAQTRFKLTEDQVDNRIVDPEVKAYISNLELALLHWRENVHTYWLLRQVKGAASPLLTPTSATVEEQKVALQKVP